MRMEKTEMIQHGAAGALFALFIFWFMQHSEPIKKTKKKSEALKRLKRKVNAGEIGIGLAYGFLCAAAGGMLCSPTGPPAAGCAALGGSVCGLVFWLLADASTEDIIIDIEITMDNLGCSCAKYC